MEIEPVTEVVCDLGEGPTWDAATQRVYWIDVTRPRLHAASLDGEDVRSWDLPSRVGSFALLDGDDEGVLVALTEGLHRLALDTGRIDRVDAVDSTPGVWLNDGKVDRSGRFIVGSMDAAEADPRGGLFAWSAASGAVRLDSGYICVNGPCWSPSGEVMYCADSWAGMIYRFSYDPESGRVGDRQPFIDVSALGDGIPDGCTVDAEGFLWSANLFGSRLIRFSPEGQVDRMLELPVANVTSVAFGGPELDVLLVTSMGRNFRPGVPDDGPLRGRLLAIRGVGVTGIAERRVSNSEKTSI